mmetsp:Transcript_17333/g.42027  ORF Transcript_17333/g.42027 Transcript_17333/m.42027 type:complete len:273 (-) Transcript_17333:434-1252(-)
MPSVVLTEEKDIAPMRSAKEQTTRSGQRWLYTISGAEACVEDTTCCPSPSRSTTLSSSESCPGMYSVRGAISAAISELHANSNEEAWCDTAWSSCLEAKVSMAIGDCTRKSRDGRRLMSLPHSSAIWTASEHASDSDEAEHWKMESEAAAQETLSAVRLSRTLSAPCAATPGLISSLHSAASDQVRCTLPFHDDTFRSPGRSHRSTLLALVPSPSPSTCICATPVAKSCPYKVPTLPERWSMRSRWWSASGGTPARTSRSREHAAGATGHSV